jgi:hypothetical protein
LAQSNTVKTLDLDGDSLSFTITPDAEFTQNMKISFSGENIAPEKSVTGCISVSKSSLINNENCITTAWFPVDNSKSTLMMTGGFNCAIWQFKDKNNEVISSYKDKSYIRIKNQEYSPSYINKAYVTTEIPPNAVYARVTYIDSTNTDCDDLTDELTIMYGNVYSGYTDIERKTYTLPDISGEQYIEYSNGKWVLYDGSKKTVLNLGKVNANKNSTVSISGDLCGVVTFNGKKSTTSSSKEKEYGIKFSTGDGNSLCYRVGDAKGMSFNYTINNNWANDGDNDFDNAYPWCEMKLCNVSANSQGVQTITYEDDPKFATDGSNGNVMVEIPKFYTKREVKDGYEYIWISGTKHEGYTLDPAFNGRTGATFGKIYVGAYLTSYNNDKMVSVSNTYPVTNIDYQSIISDSESAGSCYSEMNYLTYSALQKLFIVETGTINSSEVFSGDTDNYYYSFDTEKTAYAVNSGSSLNTIVINYSETAKKFQVGDSIAIFENWESYNNSADVQKDITDIKYDSNKNTYTIKFSGSPVDIISGRTAITNIPRKSGKTDSIDYCTGEEEGNDGKKSFKYRGIENLYGSAIVALDGAYYRNGYFCYVNADETVTKTNIKECLQTIDPTKFQAGNILGCIKAMAYDSENPLVMMPELVGDSTSSNTYYGDYWYSPEVNKNSLYIGVGGSNSDKKFAGLFQMRVYYENDKQPNVGGRLIFR